MKIHILGPSGSGTTTLGKALAKKYNIPHFDADDFFWQNTDPPFTYIRDTKERTALLKSALKGRESWIITGSMTGWGDFLIPQFDLVIYLYVEKEIRIKRLKARERERFGDRIDQGNDMSDNHRAFIEWASSYEEGGMDMRSKQRHEAWLQKLNCKIIRIKGEMGVEQLTQMVDNKIFPK